jgi:hypothetical protein
MGTCNGEYEDENFADLKFIKQSPWFAPGDNPPGLNNVSRPGFNVMIFNDKKIRSRNIRCTFSFPQSRELLDPRIHPLRPGYLRTGPSRKFLGVLLPKVPSKLFRPSAPSIQQLTN